jgi:peptidoglycan LD-endopeptidase LytH
MKSEPARVSLPRTIAAWVLAPVMALTVGVALPVLAAEGANFVRTGEARPLSQIMQVPELVVAKPVEAPVYELVWRGADVDGDGAADFANPTGKESREHDAYGSGAFGASRDGGQRRHAGVDYVAEAGQAVAAPISGFVSRIGFVYGDDSSLRYVEITNPATGYEARAFYVDPSVEIGQAVRVGQPIGEAETLQARYPAGITDHVHLEIVDARGRQLDAEGLIVARRVLANEARG